MRPKHQKNDFHWSPELAYVIGLLVTDGNLSKDKRHIIMRSSDMDLLQTFKKCLNLSNKISQSYNNGYATKPSYRIQFGNVGFYNWLMDIGLMPNKTHVIGEIKIPDEFFRDFLRGHLDGDGTIYHYQDRYNIYKGKRYINTRIYTKFISASKIHIEWLNKKIIKCLHLKGSLTCHKLKSLKWMWEIKFSKYDSIKLLQKIYYRDYLPSLERKKNLARKIISSIKNNKLIRFNNTEYKTYVLR
ncbi:hypothetical protein HYW83_02325 [Candidatus Peregrinibacteria bacterium]|nr:hypothetical protein [Candidatus Peregrinibacteria bacterium]